jgi:hypothetical protein
MAVCRRLARSLPELDLAAFRIAASKRATAFGVGSAAARTSLKGIYQDRIVFQTTGSPLPSGPWRKKLVGPNGEVTVKGAYRGPAGDTGSTTKCGWAGPTGFAPFTKAGLKAEDIQSIEFIDP